MVTAAVETLPRLVLSEATAAAAVPAADRASGLTAFAAGLTALLLILRLIAGSRSPLFFDEAYYWQWSTELAAGYFDHPPVIALFLRLGTLLFRDTTLGIRFMPAVSAPLSVLAVWAIGLRLTGDRRVAAWAAIFANLTGAAVLSFVAWPDEPMVLAWLWATFGLVAVYKGGAPAWWVFAGAMIGIAGSSKYVALFLALGLFAWTLAEPSMRRQYASRWPWLGLLAAGLVMSPVLAWNATHGWPSLTMQTMRDGLSISGGESFVSYLTNIAAMSSPPLLVLALITLVRGPERRLLLLAILPMALFLAAFSQTDEVGIHWVWPMTYWVSLAAALAMSGTRLRWWNGGLAALALLLGGAVTLLYYLLLYLPTGLYGADPGRPFRGWPEVALAVEQLRQEHGATYMLGDRYFHPGYLKLALGADAPVFNVNHPGYDAEYGRWRRWDGFPSATPEMADDKAMFIGSADVARLYYDTVIPLGQVTRPNGTDSPPSIAAYLVSDPKPETMPLFNGWRGP